MTFEKYFFPLFKKADGNNPEEILKMIRENNAKNFYVLAQDYNLDWLRDCINEVNCSLIFHAEDNHSQATKVTFLSETLEPEKRKRIIFTSHKFELPQIREFLRLGGTIQLWKTEKGPIKLPVTALAKKFPDQIRLVSWGFWKFRILDYLKKKLPMVILFRNGDFELADLKSFANLGKDRAVLITDDFTDIDLEELKLAGATIWERPAAAAAEDGLLA